MSTKVMEMLELVELDQLAQRKPTQLSGGQQQRIALVRALVNRPKVLLLDEPLGALDLKLRRQMQLELKRIQTEVGITFVHVTHDQEEAMTMADTIAVMNQGRVEQLGAPGRSVREPPDRFRRRLSRSDQPAVGEWSAPSTTWSSSTSMACGWPCRPGGWRRPAPQSKPGSGPEKLQLGDRAGAAPA